MTFDESRKLALQTVAGFDEADGFKDSNLSTILSALQAGLKAPITNAAFDALVMLEDVVATARISRDTSAEWMDKYILSQGEVDEQCVLEGMSDERWNEAVEFVHQCLKSGIKPLAFVDLLIQHQKEYNDNNP